MKRCVILLDGTEKPDAIRKELVPGDLILAVDRGLETCFALDKAPRIAFVAEKGASEKAHDWAGFSGAKVEPYTVGKQGGFELALEWALTSEGIAKVEVLNPFGRSPLEDHARLLVVARLGQTEPCVSLLTPKERIFYLEGGYTLNGRSGVPFSLLPIRNTTIWIKNGKREIRRAGVEAGTLLHFKMDEAVANIQLQDGAALLCIAREQ